jgi:hypothetical protein
VELPVITICDIQPDPRNSAVAPSEANFLKMQSAKTVLPSNHLQVFFLGCSPSWHVISTIDRFKVWSVVFRFLIPCGGVRLRLLGTSATVWPIASTPDDG